MPPSGSGCSATARILSVAARAGTKSSAIDCCRHARCAARSAGNPPPGDGWSKSACRGDGAAPEPPGRPAGGSGVDDERAPAGRSQPAPRGAGAEDGASHPWQSDGSAAKVPAWDTGHGADCVAPRAGRSRCGASQLIALGPCLLPVVPPGAAACARAGGRMGARRTGCGSRRHDRRGIPANCHEQAPAQVTG
jgi:hypothetical protein